MVRYLNRAATEHYSEGRALVGRSVLDCHDEASCVVIREVLDQLRDGLDERRITDDHRFRIYMRAVRDGDGRLLGYQERYEPPVVPPP